MRADDKITQIYGKGEEAGSGCWWHDRNEMKKLVEKLLGSGSSPAGGVGGLLNLYQAPCGSRLKICQLCGNARSCQKLREMGFCENAELRVVNRGGAVVCQILGCRIGLSQSLARSILVAPAE